MGTCACRRCYGIYIERSTGEAEENLPAGTLVAVGTFSNARRMKDGSRSYEWIRYASLQGLRVMGGMGKILERFMEDVCPDDVMTYVDSSVSDGRAYLELGFEVVGEKAGDGFTNLKLRKRCCADRQADRTQQGCPPHAKP